MAEVCIICGLVGFISTIITLILGMRIISKYFQRKQGSFIYVGLTLIILWSPWWPSSISFITYLISLDGLPYEVYIFLGNFFLPFALITWVIPMCNLLGVKDKTRKIAVIICIIYIIIFLSVVIYFLFNPAELGYLRNPLVPIYSFSFYMLIMPILVIVIMLGLKLALESLKASDVEVQLKGKFLLIAFITITIGIILEIFLTGDFNLLISRIIIIIGLILLYIGLTLPKRIKELIL